MTARPPLARSASLALLALAACGGRDTPDAHEAEHAAEARPAATRTIGRKQFLLNVDRTRLLADGEAGHDFTNTGGVLPTIGEVRANGRALRALVQEPRSEVAIPRVLPYAGVLRMDVAFDSVAEGEPRTFTLEVLARRGEQEELLWTRDVTQPEDEAARDWESVEVSLPEPATDESERDTALVFRVEGAGRRRKAGRPVALPAWGNPRLEGAGYSVPAWEPEQSNVVVFLIDTLRADHVGSYGHDRPTTPVFDQLAEQGTLYLDATAPSSWTKASVASLFTSRLPSQHGAEDYPHRLPDSAVTLAEVFQGAGYRTGAVGANRWIFYPHFNFGGGFEDFLHTFDADGIRGSIADTVVDEAIDWVEQHAQDPFFLYVHLLDPHSPYDPPAGAENFLTAPYGGKIEPSNRGANAFVRFDPDTLEDADLDYLRALYDAEIAYADAEMGRFIDALKARDLWANTTFVALSDHGEEFGEHGGWEHSTTLYREQTHVPLLLLARPQGGAEAGAAKPGARIDAPVSLIDVAPTLCALAGVPWPEEFEGRDLASTDAHAALVASELNLQDRRLYSLTDGSLKYIATVRPETREEAYRIDSDPSERTNVVGELTPEELEPFRRRLAELRADSVPDGLYIELCGAGRAVEVRGTLSSDRPLRDVNPLSTEYSVDGSRLEGDRALFAGDAQKVVLIEMSVGPGDERDFVHIGTEPGAQLVFQGRFNAGAEFVLGPENVRAVEDEPAGKLRSFQLAADDPRLGTNRIPDPTPQPSLRVFRLKRDLVELEPDQIEALRALGYDAGEH